MEHDLRAAGLSLHVVGSGKRGKSLPPQAKRAVATQATEFAEALTEVTFLASLLKVADITNDDMKLPRKLLAQYGSLSVIVNTPVDELSANSSLGLRGAAILIAMRRLLVQAAYAPLQNVPVINNFDALVTYLEWNLGYIRRERFQLLSLDANYRIQCDEVLAEGAACFVQIDIPTILRRALRNFASHIILVHNHPSGNPEPSLQDGELTMLVQRACTHIGIELLDHIIVARGRWCSFRQNGIIK